MKGFSVVELLVALGIIISVSLVAVPLFVGYQKNAKLRDESRLLATNLRLTQQMAVTEQINYGLILDPNTDSYSIVNPETANVVKTVVLNPEISIDGINGFTANTVRFNAIGGAIETGNIVLINTKNSSSTIEIKPSGYVQIIE